MTVKGLEREIWWRNLQRLRHLLRNMEDAGANDMGWLTKQQAGWFHEATDLLRRIVIEQQAEDT